MIKQQDINKLANVALFARNRSIVPISNFAVGAALLSSDGQIFVGCNIECYGQTPSICAERVALFKALSEGVTDFLALAVAGGPKDKTPDDFCQPCGVCRQVLMQYCPGDMPVFVVKNEQEIQKYTLRQLLPYAWQRKRGIEE